MKKKARLFIVLLALIAMKSVPQNRPENSSDPYTVNGVFDQAYDRYGNAFPLKNMVVGNADPFGTGGGSTSPGKGAIGGPQGLSSTPPFCSAGKFDLYFAPGGFFDNNVPAQNVICMLFTDLSNFLISTLPNSTRINIYCDKTPTGGPPNVLGTASSVFLLPFAQANPNGGIADNVIYTALTTGQSPFNNVPSTAMAAGTNFYYGYVNVNPNIAWHLQPTVPLSNPNNYDLYTLLLHEVTHALGFASAIGQTGASLIGAGPGVNFYSRFDQFLYSASGQPLLKSTTSPNCTSSNLVFQGPTTKINPGSCTGSGSDFTNCGTAVTYIGSVNVKVYTPNCWEAGSSLSHFEDMCTVPPGYVAPCSLPNNNTYYVMSNASGPGNCYVKRHLVKEERSALCDIGYKVNGVYTSPALDPVTSMPINFNYGTGTCPGTAVWGISDGFVSGNFTYVAPACSTSYVLSTSALSANDAAGSTVSCVEVVYNNATISTSGSNITVTANAAGVGMVMLKYLPLKAGKYGNATYVYVYFPPCGCTPPNPCNMIQNPGFESLLSGPCGGPINFNFIGSGPVLSCWENYDEYPNLLSRGCTSSALPSNGYGPFNLGTNTWNSVPPFDTYQNPSNGSPNNRILYFWYDYAYGKACTAKNSLGASLVPGQTYQLSFLAWNSTIATHPGTPPTGGSNTTIPGIPSPVVVTIASAPNVAITGINYPTGLNVVTSLTIYPTQFWSVATTTFVFNGTSNHSAFLIGIDKYLTNALGTIPSQQPGVAVMIDDISLNPISAVSLSLPQLSGCSVSYSNLAQFTGFTPGTFSGTGVTLSNGVYSFNSPPTLTAGSYPIGFNYTSPNGCTTTLWQNVVITPAPTLSASGSATWCAWQPTTTVLGATLSTGLLPGSTYSWSPGNLTGQNVTVGPGATTVYTVTAISASSCIATATVGVVINYTCCPQPYNGTMTIGTNVLNAGGSLAGPIVIDQNVTITGSGVYQFTGGEYIMAPNVQITVSPNVQLLLTDAHLYSCNGLMWQGIQVMDGAAVVSYPGSAGKSTLIEDAITAIDVNNITAAHANPLLDLKEVVFNKNFTGIDIRNSGVTTLPLTIYGCVFTSRNLPFTATTWPNASITDLRFTPSGRANLFAPCPVGSYGSSVLKSPYTNQPGYIGIHIDNIDNVPGGTPSTGVDISTWLNGNNRDFNLFDNLGTGIYVNNASLSTANNIFQNMLYYGTTFAPFVSTGAGIYHNIDNPTMMNAQLVLTPMTMGQGTGNNFWDCYYGVRTNNVLTIDMQDAVIRSTQDVNNGVGFYPGNTGVLMESSRFFNYNVSHNELNNIEKGIHLRLSPGMYDVNGSGPQNGIYAFGFAINENYIGPEMSNFTGLGNEYCNNGIIVEGPSNASWAMYHIGTIISNEIDRTYRGIFVNDMSTYPVGVHHNNVNIETDMLFGGPQYGINFTNSQGFKSAESNNTSANNITSNISLFLCQQSKGTDLFCNSTYNSRIGFEFSGNSNPSNWKGNLMQQHKYGMALTNNGIIGQQGSANNPVDNQWLGSWGAGSFETYAFPPSSAINSPMYIQWNAPYQPFNNGGSPVSDTYSGVNNLIFSKGMYTCPGNTYPNPPTHRTAMPLAIESIDGEQWAGMVELFPNPTDGRLNVKSVTASEQIEISIVDVTGKLVYSKTVTTSDHLSSIDLKLQNGVYLVNVQTADKKLIRKKLVITN